jgi:hypothetical protein
MGGELWNQAFFWHEHQEKWLLFKMVWQGVSRMTQPRGTRRTTNLEMSNNPFQTPHKEIAAVAH